MANKITIKRAAGAAASQAPASNVITAGELAYSYNNMLASTSGDGDNADIGGVDNNGSGKLFIGGPDDLAPVVIGGAYYTDKIDHFITGVVDGVQQDSKVLSTDASGNLVYNDGNINFDNGTNSLDVNNTRLEYSGDGTSIKVANALDTNSVELLPHRATFVGDVIVDGDADSGAVLTVKGNAIDAEEGIEVPTGVSSQLGGLTVLNDTNLNGDLVMTASKAISGVGTVNTVDLNATGDVDVTGTLTANALDINVSLDVNTIQAGQTVIAGNASNSNIGGTIKADAAEFDTIEGHQGALVEVTGNASTVTELRDAINVTLSGDITGNVNGITLGGGTGGAGITITNMDIQSNVVGENEIDMANVSLIDFKDDEFALDVAATVGTGLKNAVLDLEDRIQALDSDSGTTMSDLQTELDDTQTGAGLGADGSYNANGAANYISASTSLADADNDLDAALKTQADKQAADDATLRTELTDETIAVAKVVARTISLSGDVAGSVSYDATGNVDIVSTIQAQQVEDSMIANDTITNSKIVNSNITFSSHDQNGDITTGHVELGTNLPFQGTTNEIEVAVADHNGVDGIKIGLPDDVTIGNDLAVSGDAVITGDLSVLGTTTTINTQEVTVEDKVLRIANNAATDAAMDGSGIELGTAGAHALLWDDAVNAWSTGADDGFKASNGEIIIGDTVKLVGTLGSNNLDFGGAVVDNAQIDGGTF